MKGTAYYDMMTASLDRREALGEMTDEEIKEVLQDSSSDATLALREYKTQLDNKSESKEETMDTSPTEENVEIVKRIAKNAKDFKQTMQDAEQQKKQVEKDFGGEIDDDGMEALVFQQLAIKNAEKRMEQMDQELAQVQEGNSTLNEEKELSGKYGSLASIKQTIEDLKKRKEDLEKSMANEKDMKTLVQKAQKGEQLTEEESDKLRTYLIHRNMVERANSRLKDLNKAAKKLEARKNQVEGEESTDEKSLVLSAEEIMALKPSDRAFMLNPQNRSKYSAAQQKVIDELNQKGQQKYGKDWQKKLGDRARLEMFREQNLKIQNQLMESADKLAQYVHGAKMNKAVDSKIKQLESVYEHADDNADSYSRFVDLVTEDDGDDIITKMAKDRLMRKYGESSAVKKYQSRKAKNDKAWQAFTKSSEYKEMTSD